MIYWISYFLMKLFNRIYFTCTFSGQENLPSKGSFILASNHLSNLDPFIIGICARRKFSYLAKESLFKTKFLNFYFRQVGAFPIKRDTSDFHAMREALRRLKSGCPLILFPEGTRGAGTRAKKTQPGVGFIAQKSQVPVFPAYIEGSDKALPNNAKWFKRAHIKIKIGKPILFSDDKTFPEIANQIMEQVALLSR